jgi:hypothetical protein
MVAATNEPEITYRPNLSWAIAFSLLVHLCLALLLPRLPAQPTRLAPLQAHLAPTVRDTTIPPIPSPTVRSLPEQPSATATSDASAPARSVQGVPATVSPTTPVPTVDVAAAMSTARAIAKEPLPRTTLGPTRTPITLETAIAKATQPDVIVESRGANGEWVTQDRKSRCVGRIQRKWFEEGVPMLTLCEIKKG